MKDNDLLVTELYHDPSNDAITALSVYLTPKTSQYTQATAASHTVVPILMCMPADHYQILDLRLTAAVGLQRYTLTCKNTF